MQRYFLDFPHGEASAKDATYQVMGDHFHHMTRVMRMNEGEHVYLVFSDEISIEAQIIGISDQSVTLVEVAVETKKKELPVHVTIASGYPKGDKLELIVQKGTELGAHQFIGFPAKTSVVKWDAKKLSKKQERLQKIAQEAAEQSHRHSLPIVNLLASEQELVSQFSMYDEVLIAYEESAKDGEAAQLVQTFSSLKPGQRLLIVFGPEGGFAPNEIEQFLENGAKLCGLGPRILRTETAPFYALAAASFYFELQLSNQ